MDFYYTYKKFFGISSVTETDDSAADAADVFVTSSAEFSLPLPKIFCRVARNPRT